MRYPAAAKTPIVAQALTDQEKMALAIIRHAGAAGINSTEIGAQTFEDRVGGKHRRWDEGSEGRFSEAITSLKRFGFVDERYDRADYHSVRPGQTGYGMGRGWLYYLNEAGEAAIAQVRSYHYRCCENCVSLFCVCSEKTFCPEHGGGCHGTHD
jgi:hypothetical protein